MTPLPLHELRLHGHRVAYRLAGEGPAVVLVHGITSTSAVWDGVGERLVAAGHTVLAPDLLGHGDSAKPTGDYSLGAHASGVRDLMVALGLERATFVGHSFGGGVAMQLAYQFPERAERLVLVDSGGLGREVTPLLRAATLPGAELVLPLLADARARRVAGLAAGALARLGMRPSTDTDEIGRALRSFADPGARHAFLLTLRAAVDPGGQRVDARDRLYLAEALPLLVIWGARDRVIPAAHGREVHELVPGSRFVELAGAGHHPMLDDPAAVADLLVEFVGGTEPAALAGEERMRELLTRAAA